MRPVAHVFTITENFSPYGNTTQYHLFVVVIFKMSVLSAKIENKILDFYIVQPLTTGTKPGKHNGLRT